MSDVFCIKGERESKRDDVCLFKVISKINQLIGTAADGNRALVKKKKKQKNFGLYGILKK